MTVTATASTITEALLPRPAYAAMETFFAPDAVWVGRSRRMSDAFLRWCQVTRPLAEDIVLCVSELVTNSVTHGKGDVSLRIRNGGDEIHVEVADGNPAPATMRSADEDELSGRGLLLVKALSGEWGVSEDGRSTWCTFCLRGGRA